MVTLYIKMVYILLDQRIIYICIQSTLKQFILIIYTYAKFLKDIYGQDTKIQYLILFLLCSPQHRIV